MKDQSFLSASPEEQSQYVSSFDPDFAKASKEDQSAYLQHVTGRQSISPGNGAPPMPKAPYQTIKMEESPLAPAGNSLINQGQAAYAKDKTHGMPGSFEGHPENVGEYIPQTVGEAGGGVKDIAQGNIARGAHRIISGALNVPAPLLPIVGAAAPVPTVVGLATGALGQKAGKAGSKALGASEDQSDLIGDITGLVGGYGGSKIGAKIPGIVSDAIAPKPLPPPEAARGVTQAINPPAEQWNSHIAATEAEAGNIKAFAQRNNLPLKTQLDWAKASRGAAQEAQQLYQQKILGPMQDQPVSVAGTGYRGTTVGEGQNAKLGDINARITTINDELRNAYVKRQEGQTRTAIASDADLAAERSALTDILHNELSRRTGVPAENIAALRQRFGRQYSLADQTLAKVNQRQSGISNANEGANTPTSKTGFVSELINKARGGPEAISNRAFRKALGKTGNIQATDLPEVNPPATPNNPRVPSWQNNNPPSTVLDSIMDRPSTSSGPGREIFGPSSPDPGAPFPRRPSWQNIPDVIRKALPPESDVDMITRRPPSDLGSEAVDSEVKNLQNKVDNAPTTGARMKALEKLRNAQDKQQGATTPQESKTNASQSENFKTRNKPRVGDTMTPEGAALDNQVLQQVKAENPDMPLGEQLQLAAKRAAAARGGQ